MYQQSYIITVEREEAYKTRRARAQRRMQHAQRAGAIQGGTLAVLVMVLLMLIFARGCTPKEQELPVASTATPTPTTEVITLEHTEVIPTTPEPARDWMAEAEVLAKTVYGEARGCSTTEQAAVIWCILNRVDDGGSYWPDDIIGVATQDSQFHGWDEAHPVLPELYELALDVIDRWQREKEGERNVGRVLPSDYFYFHGDGLHNHFRQDWRSGEVWDWSLPSPYEE